MPQASLPPQKRQSLQVTCFEEIVFRQEWNQTSTTVLADHALIKRDS
jgi:hypothetical protein